MKQIVEECLVMNTKTKEWSGSLPAGCRTVQIQYLEPDGSWSKVAAGASRPRGRAIELIEDAVRKGPLGINYKKYRLVPMTESTETDNNSNSIEGENEMSTTKKKAATKKTKTAATGTEELVAGRYRPNSMSGKMLTFLSDEKPHSVAEIAKAINPRSTENIGTGKYAALRAYGVKNELYLLQKQDDGKLVMTVGADAVKNASAAPKKEKAKPATAKATKAKAAPKASPKKDAKKAKAKAAPKAKAKAAPKAKAKAAPKAKAKSAASEPAPGPTVEA